MKKILINLSLMGALALIAPSVINNVSGIVHNLKQVTTFIFNQVNIASQTNFQNSQMNQDDKGNYWLSSSTGLLKSTDGVNFVAIEAATDLPVGANIADLFCLQDSVSHGIWVLNGSTSGWTLYFTNNYGITFKAAFIAGLSTTITGVSMIEDNTGCLWLSTAQGLFKSANHATFAPVTSGLPTSFSPFTVFQSASGTIYTVDKSHVYSSSDGLNFKENTGVGLPAVMGTADGKNQGPTATWPKFYQDSIGTLYLATNYQLFKCNTVKPATFDTVTRIGGNASFPDILSVAIGKDNSILAGFYNPAPKSGQVFKSTDFGATFTGGGPNVIASNIKIDKQNNVWAFDAILATDSTMYEFANGYVSSATEYLQNKGVFSFFQDSAENVWICTANGLWKSSSETYSGTGYNTTGKIVNTQFQNKNYIMSNQNINFHANDASVTTVIFNGVKNIVNGKGFTKNLTESENGGVSNITVNYSDGTISEFNFVVASDNKNMAQFSTDPTNSFRIYKALLKGSLVNYIFVTSNSLNTDSNLKIKLGLSGYNPIIDKANSYYEQLDPFSFAVMPGTKTNLTDDTSIAKNGLYLVTLIDLLGNTNQYYVQLGSQGDAPFLPVGNQWIPVSSASPVVKNNSSIMWIIITSALGSLLVILLVSWLIVHHRSNIKNKLKTTKNNSNSK